MRYQLERTLESHVDDSRAAVTQKSVHKSVGESPTEQLQTMHTDVQQSGKAAQRSREIGS